MSSFITYFFTNCNSAKCVLFFILALFAKGDLFQIQPLLFSCICGCRIDYTFFGSGQSACF